MDKFLVSTFPDIKNPTDFIKKNSQKKMKLTKL